MAHKEFILATSADMKDKRQRSLKRKLTYAAIPTILAFLIIEGLFRIYMLVHGASEVRRRYEDLAQRTAYASKPWFSRDFVASLMAHTPGFYTPNGTLLVVPKD